MSTRRRRTKLFSLLLTAGLLLACFGLAAADAGPAPEPAWPPAAAPEPAAEPQGGRRRGGQLKTTGPTKGPVDRFLHEHHSGQVPVPGKKGQTRELKCETCHAVSDDKTMWDTNKFPGPDLIKHPETAKLANTGTRLNRIGFAKAHSACTECHNEIGPGSRQMCDMCHVTSTLLKPFPNPDVEQSQFADRYSHRAHKDYFDSFPDPSKASVEARRSPFALVSFSPQAPAREKGLRCADCHTPAQNGVKMTLPQHDGCFTCHSNPKIVSKRADTYATACVGCHANMAENKPTIASETQKPKVPREAQYAVAPEVMPIRYVVTPTGRGNAPFNHVGGRAKYHEVLKVDTGRSAGKTLEGKAACLFCHTSTERAASRPLMKAFAAKRGEPEQVQPPATACVACHVHAAEMVLPEKPTAAARNKCMTCHTAADAAKPVPASHLPEGSPAAPAATKPAPAAPETKPETKPAAKPPAKPAPAPETKPAAQPPAKPEPAKPAAEAPKPEPTKPAAEAPKPEPEAPKPEPKAEAPKPEPAAPSAAAPAGGKYAQFAIANPDGSPPSKTVPGKLMLGRRDDPISGKIWGQDPQWGVVAFDHGTHIQPKYAASCEVCHHTNTDAKSEGVLRCVACHRETGYEKNPLNADGSEEVDVKLAYHGNADNTQNQAGCIACHKQRNVEPSGSCSGCHAPASAVRRVEVRPRFVATARLVWGRDWWPEARRWNPVERAAPALAWNRIDRWPLAPRPA